MAFKCSIWVCAVLVCSLLVLSEALPATHNLNHRLSKRSGIRLCGRMLVDALAAICQSAYYSPSHIKKSYPYIQTKYPTWAEEGILDPQSALNFFDTNQLERNARGIADECCQKSCSYFQLASYCGPVKQGI